MTLEQRVAKLVKILKDDEGFIEYKKPIPRLRFKIMRIYQNDKVYFCMLMGDSELQYVDMADLTIDELAEVVDDLENMLIDG